MQCKQRHIICRVNSEYRLQKSSHLSRRYCWNGQVSEPHPVAESTPVPMKVRTAAKERVLRRANPQIP